MKQIIFRCDATADIGIGHLMRCLTLAKDLHKRNWTIGFYVSPETRNLFSHLIDGAYQLFIEGEERPESANWLIIDHYGLDAQYARQARTWSDNILVIDDLANRHHDCDLLIDQTFGRKKDDYSALAPEKCQILCGSDYALLRPEFHALREATLQKRYEKRNAPLKHVLVSMGGTNIHDITSKVLNAIELFDAHPLDINVVLQSQARDLEKVQTTIEAINRNSIHSATLSLDVKNMAQVMANAELAIGAGGTTSWERCALGLPTLMAEIADNQHKIAKELHKAGAVYNLGWHEELTNEKLNAALIRFCESPTYLYEMSQNAAKICDGSGIARIIKAMEMGT